MILESPTEESPSPIASSRYETIAPIGRGGMAEVFLAVTVGAGGIAKLAVLKRIWPELASDSQFLAMFLDEARLSVRMSHPNLVQTYEVLEEDGGLAIAMEYLDGQPLGRVLNRMNGEQTLSLPQRVRIVTKLLAGLDYAHELTDYDGTPLSVVHRDVSPHNVFITYDGGVKLVDFGVAKSVADAHHTRPGTIKGKFSYMAPEQFQGESADRRTDIFSVGVILWEMLAGRRFWSGVPDNQIAGYLMSDRPLPALPEELGLPVEFAEICSRALSRDRTERYDTAAEMEADLGQVLTSTREASSRLLGKAVAEAFAVERSERQLLIDRHLRRIRSGSYPVRSGSYPVLGGGAYPTPSTSLPPMVISNVPAPTRFPRMAVVALSVALPALVLVAILSGRGTVSPSAPSPIASPQRAATVDPPVPEVVVTDRPDSIDPRRSGENERERARRTESARRNRRVAGSSHRGGAAPAAATNFFPVPASGADFGGDQQRALPQARPINIASPFQQRAVPLARPIETTNPFQQRPLPQPRAIDTTNPFLPRASPPANE